MARDLPPIADDLVEMITEWSDGYIAVVVMFIEAIRKEFPENSLSGKAVNVGDIYESNLVTKLYQHHEYNNPEVYRSLPTVLQLRDHDIKKVFRTLLRNGFVPKPNERCTDSYSKAVSACHSNGWVYAVTVVKNSMQSPLLRQNYVFPHPFGQSWISWNLDPLEENLSASDTLSEPCMG
ncbi:hypothetical protein BDP27DRAFT_624908 [Rhodocollybia butyracea]|uniref:Uncharacterized protein n=1 Tax=Rhodocollybia butyracea TaxID=206335 RepID=A0A9P5PWG6_9AGAR|nr:hypothetical protein BDP27DRAFT_624908 [Rhodocollybia butyracea]